MTDLGVLRLPVKRKRDLRPDVAAVGVDAEERRVFPTVLLVIPCNPLIEVRSGNEVLVAYPEIQPQAQPPNLAEVEGVHSRVHSRGELDLLRRLDVQRDALGHFS